MTRAYGAAKAGVGNFMSYLHTTYRNDGIRATAILPGETDTPILDNRARPPSAQERATMLQPEDVAAAVVLAASLPPRAVIEELRMASWVGRARPHAPRTTPIAPPDASPTRRPNYGPQSRARLDFLGALPATWPTGHQRVSPRSRRGHGAFAAGGEGDAMNPASRETHSLRRPRARPGNPSACRGAVGVALTAAITSTAPTTRSPLGHDTTSRQPLINQGIIPTMERFFLLYYGVTDAPQLRR